MGCAHNIAFDEGFVPSYLVKIQQAPYLRLCGTEYSGVHGVETVSRELACGYLSDMALDCYLTKDLEKWTADITERCYSSVSIGTPLLIRLFCERTNYNRMTKKLAAVEDAIWNPLHRVEREEAKKMFPEKEKFLCTTGVCGKLWHPLSAAASARMCGLWDEYPLLKRLEELIFLGGLPLDIKTKDSETIVLVY